MSRFREGFGRVRPVVGAAGGDVGDANVWEVATYDAAAGGAELANGDEQHVTGTGRRYKRVAGAWVLYGMVSGVAIPVAGIGSWSDPGDSIAGSVVAKDTSDDNRYYRWSGSDWVVVSTLSELIGGAGVSGADLYDWIGSGVTVEQNTGLYAVNGSSLRVSCDPGEAVVLSYTLPASDKSTSLQQIIAPWGELITETADSWAVDGFILLDNDDVDLTTGQWAGVAGASAPGASSFLFGAGMENQGVRQIQMRFGTSSISANTSAAANAHWSGNVLILGRSGSSGFLAQTYVGYASTARTDGTEATSRSFTSATTTWTRARVVVAVHHLGVSGQLVMDLRKLAASQVRWFE